MPKSALRLSLGAFVRDFKQHWRGLVKFAIVFQLLTAFLLKPIAYRAGNLLLNRAGIPSLRLDALGRAAGEPLFWLAALLAMMTVTFLLVFEFSTYVYLSSSETPELPFWTKLRYVFDRVDYMLMPHRLPLLLLLMPLLLVISSIYSSTVINDYHIPRFVMDTIRKTPWMVAVYTCLVLLIIYAALRTCFTLQGFILGKLSWRNAFRQSLHLTRTFARTVFFTLLVILLLTAILMGLLQLLGVGIVYVIMRLYRQGEVLTGMDLTLLFGIRRLLRHLSMVMLTAVTVSALTQLYRLLGGKFVKNRRTPVPLNRHLRQALSGLTAIGLLLALAYQLWSIMYITIPVGDWWNLSGSVEIVAHRGASQHAPENTIVAIEEAIAQQADRVEIDVQLSRDGEVVLFHDRTLRRIAGRSERIADLTLEEISKIDAGSWFAPQFREARIPTLAEALKTGRDRIKFNIELKPDGNEEALAQAVVKVLAEENAFHSSELSSLDLSALEAAKASNPLVRIGIILPLITGHLTPDDPVDFYSVEFSQVSISKIEDAHAMGRPVHVWTVNTVQGFDRMRELQVDGVITDYPAEARARLTGSPFELGFFSFLTEIR